MSRIRPHRPDRVRASSPRLVRSVVPVVVALLLSLSACGSSDSSSGGTSGGSDKAGLDAAAKAVAKYSAVPTALGVTQPLPSAPRSGRTVVFLQCEVPQCKDGGDGFRAGAAAVGWNVKTMTWKTTDPSSLVNEMQQALQLSPKPYAVSISGLPQAIWGSQVAAYAKAGVLLVPWSLGPVTLNKTVIAEVLSPEDIELQGKLLADWVIKDSGGKGKILLQGIPQYPSIDEEATGFNNEIKASCSGCKVTRLDVTGDQVASNGVTPAIVSAVQRDPSIEYVACADIALAPGLPAALKAAGLEKVKIVGGAASQSDEQDVREGKVSAVMKNDLVYAGWLMVDVLLRHDAGATFAPNGGGLPQQILTKSTVAPAGSTDLVPPNYPDLFKKAWLSE